MSDYKPAPVLPPDSSSGDPEFSSSREESRQETARSKPLWREYAEAIVIALVSGSDHPRVSRPGV